jgi:hypothetical protein
MPACSSLPRSTASAAMRRDCFDCSRVSVVCMSVCECVRARVCACAFARVAGVYPRSCRPSDFPMRASRNHRLSRSGLRRFSHFFIGFNVFSPFGRPTQSESNRLVHPWRVGVPPPPARQSPSASPRSASPVCVCVHACVCARSTAEGSQLNMTAPPQRTMPAMRATSSSPRLSASAAMRRNCSVCSCVRVVCMSVRVRVRLCAFARAGPAPTFASASVSAFSWYALSSLSSAAERSACVCVCASSVSAD